MSDEDNPPKTIMLVFGNYDLSNMFRIYLRGNGYAIVVASDCAVARSLLFASKPDLIFIEDQVGEEDGIGFVE